jgi:hypothetical protein
MMSFIVFYQLFSTIQNPSISDFKYISSNRMRFWFLFFIFFLFSFLYLSFFCFFLEDHEIEKGWESNGGGGGRGEIDR